MAQAADAASLISYSDMAQVIRQALLRLPGMLLGMVISDRLGPCLQLHRLVCPLHLPQQEGIVLQHDCYIGMQRPQRLFPQDLV